MISEFTSVLRLLEKLVFLYRSSTDRVQKAETRKKIESLFNNGIDLASNIEQLEKLYQIVPVLHRGYTQMIGNKTKRKYNKKGNDLLSKKAETARTKKQVLQFFDRYGCDHNYCRLVNNRIRDFFEKEKDISQKYWDDLDEIHKEWYPDFYTEEMIQLKKGRKIFLLKAKYLVEKYLITPKYQRQKNKLFPFYPLS